MRSSEGLTRKNRAIAIPIVEHGSNRVVGGFCASMDVVSAPELQALAQLKTLRARAEQVKLRLRETVDIEEKNFLSQRLETLRKEAAIWRAKREQATKEKHLALGHVRLPTG